MINLAELNKEQREAVEAIEGPVLAISCAGSGKTKMLTYKIANMIEKGVEPSSILAITFTNKAAKEMKTRVENLVGEDKKGTLLCTFHKFGLILLKKYIGPLGYSTDFTIYDTDDQKKVINRILKELDLVGNDRLKPKYIIHMISKFKRNYIDPDGALAIAVSDIDRLVAKIYKTYNEILFKSNSIDFDDMIMLPVKLLEQEPSIKAKIQDQYKYILVDEYQDTDQLQYKLIKLLTDNTKEPNLTVVGDDDQSIYKFRGADVTNILNFENDFPTARVIRLEQNYRSTMNILNSAYSVIKNNVNRKDKKLWSDKGDGEKVYYSNYYDDRDEAKQVIEKIKEIGDYKNTALLYRANYQSRRFEEILIRNKIPYSIRDSISFYAREEVKDLMAYLKLLCNPQDVEAFTRIINVPRRGLGPSSVKKILDYKNKTQQDLLQILSSIEQLDFKGKTLAGLISFRELINYLKELNHIDEVFNAILDDGGYKQYLTDKYKADEEDLKNKLQNIQELRNVAFDYIRLYPESHPEKTKEELEIIKNMSAKTILQDFINDLALNIPSDNKDDTDDKVQLMTLHSSKGLEFDNVFIVGMNNNIFPCSNCFLTEDSSEEEKTELEEERRLCYVGLTRAKKHLYLSSFKQGFVYGQEHLYEPSIFIDEIDERYMLKG